MSVKIRLTRMGKKKQPSYRVVVMDSRKPRDGEYIEQIGRYDPRAEPSLVEIDNDKALMWLQRGAQPTDRAKKLLEISGAWTRFRVAKGDIHTIEVTPSAPEPVEPIAEVEPVVEAEPAAEPVAEAVPAAEPVAEAMPAEVEVAVEADPVAEAGDETESQSEEEQA